ncbi:MAG: S-layer homology domain-containing protein [bacterium]
MKQIAVVLAAILSLALVAPALAQPFADVPTDHWAYDAIAELAAKGLVEGYPDGAFRGDRAMTRYEMAMVVARLLARIEAIKIPPLPADLADISRIHRARGLDGRTGHSGNGHGAARRDGAGPGAPRHRRGGSHAAGQGLE